MKTGLKNKIKSSYQAILDYFSWLFVSEKEKENLYAVEEDVEEMEITAVVTKHNEEITISSGEVYSTDVIVDETVIAPPNRLTNKQNLILECMPENIWLTSTVVGNMYCAAAYGENAKEGRSQYASKTLNELVELGFLIKNEEKKYKKA